MTPPKVSTGLFWMGDYQQAKSVTKESQKDTLPENQKSKGLQENYFFDKARAKSL